MAENAVADLNVKRPNKPTDSAVNSSKQNKQLKVVLCELANTTLRMIALSAAL